MEKLEQLDFKVCLVSPDHLACPVMMEYLAYLGNQACLELKEMLGQMVLMERPVQLGQLEIQVHLVNLVCQVYVASLACLEHLVKMVRSDQPGPQDHGELMVDRDCLEAPVCLD